MDRRITVVVALFVSAIALLGTWLLLSSDATVAPSERTGTERSSEAGNAASGDRPAGVTSGAHELRPMRPPNRAATSIEELRARGINVDRIAAPVSGSTYTLDSDGAALAVASRRTGLDSCYGTALLHSPDLSATQSLTIQVAPAAGKAWGNVTSVDTDGAATESVFESCAQSVLGELRFRDVTSASTLTVPVTLHAP